MVMCEWAMVNCEWVTCDTMVNGEWAKSNLQFRNTMIIREIYTIYEPDFLFLISL